MTTQRKAELFSGLIKGFDGLLDDATYYSILHNIGMTHREMEAEGLDLREQYRQYAALDELCERLSTFVDYAAAEYIRMLEGGERASLHLTGRARDFDIEMEGNGMLWDTVTEMIGERLTEYNLDMEIDNGDLILTPREPDMEMGMNRAAHIPITTETEDCL